MHPNVQLIETLYAALARRDGAAMAACYARHARFKDPVFDLRDDEVGAMWQMLCERASDLRVEWHDVTADASSGSAHVEAWYTFSVTGRPVHNVIDAKFRFADGRIIKHRDRFDLWRGGAHAIWLDPGGIAVATVDAWRGDRPWVPRHGPAQLREPGQRSPRLALNSGE